MYRQTPGKHALVVAVAALAIVVVALGYAAVPSAASGSSKPAVTRIHVIERELLHRLIDQGKHGMSPGDKVVITSDMLSARGTLIGRADFDCTVTGAGRHSGGVCQGVVTLPGGQLTGQFGVGPSGETEKQAITGGSGKYEGARGQFIIGEAKGAEEHVTIELLR